MAQIRAYRPDADKDAVHRIWREVGWMDDKTESMDLLVGAGCALVAELEGTPECLTISAMGDFRYQDETLPFTGVTGVTTSHVGRRRRLARSMTAQLIAEDVAAGAQIAGLGMFDQGFYNHLGLGSGSYEHEYSFDPSCLSVDVPFRVPRRLTTDDWQMIHDGRCARLRPHGSVNFCSADVTRSQLIEGDVNFGFGYCDDAGKLTHGLWISCGSGDRVHGPYHVQAKIYQNFDQLFELLAFLTSLSDQVFSIHMVEPAGFRLQDLIQRPFRNRTLTRGSKYSAGTSALAWWQMRVCDLAATLEKTHLDGDPVRFNLRLSDPIERFLDESAPWHGISGDYVVTLGPSSGVESGQAADLPTLEATVNAWTRMWLGVLPASSLAITDRLSGPEGLLRDLDRLIRLPEPHTDWGF